MNNLNGNIQVFPNGKDGFSPIANFEEQEDGINLKIIDKEGEKSTFIRHGRDGINGHDGRDGIDGRTPIAGTDFYTEAEKATFKNRIKEEILSENNFATQEDVEQMIKQATCSHQSPVPKTIKFGKRDKCCKQETRCLDCDKLISSTEQTNHRMEFVKDNGSSTKYECPNCGYAYIKDNETDEIIREYEKDYGN